MAPRHRAARDERRWRDSRQYKGAVAEPPTSAYFVFLSQSILYRGAGIAAVWRQFPTMASIGGLFVCLAPGRFRSVAARTI
jgi:hypothetical protein